jgi:hypothetical protein
MSDKRRHTGDRFPIPERLPSIDGCYRTYCQ